jgi:hypothetical protein
VGEGAEDDVALLAVRMHAQDEEWPPPRGPVLVQPAARRR